ncbi:MAG: 30S ribosomal protein S17 [Candidatus Omnitrophica bacterium CG08_land_8_20_14_0_20_41_16]|uniref:Small ribosomal subunit protein uS17 n=1 Tax=Candidatus Sherwoodlollariibacterium unditelluris TaxID=1974757 RepID=A0A2G9YHI7_9BACT|nr:MAG: 30S ribosomal protein S17 [Candidatus Omnitrophica bacterium CG23_combo_of_CG06-09_8_20_14_all_41_10]PIS33806.1 MAG: 30S ribosomal protein S17 [Candidatus Omnitrophica bacterium CG08_land_8_20_14_0_20_41_16]
MGERKEFTGTVVSDKMQKTVIVKVLRISKHPKYSRIMKSYNKFKAHDEKGAAKLGDIVRIEETRPLSKDKHFRVLEVIKKAEASDIQIDEEQILKEIK